MPVAASAFAEASAGQVKPLRLRRTEDRGQRTEDRGQRTEDRRQMSEIRCQISALTADLQSPASPAILWERLYAATNAAPKSGHKALPTKATNECSLTFDLRRLNSDFRLLPSALCCQSSAFRRPTSDFRYLTSLSTASYNSATAKDLSAGRPIALCAGSLDSHA
jgi:hypothetical protein